MSSSNKSNHDANNNVNYASHFSCFSIVKKDVVQSSNISAKSRKGSSVIFTKETLVNMSDQKPKSGSTKDTLKEQSSITLNTSDNEKSTVVNVDDAITNESVIKEKSEWSNQPQKPEVNAASKIVELNEIDNNILNTNFAKTKIPVPKRKRQEMEAKTPVDAINLPVSEKEFNFSDSKVRKTIEDENKSINKAIINKSLQTDKNLTLEEIKNLFETSNSDGGLQAIEVSSKNIEAQLVFNKLLSDELENSLPDSNLGITLVWESKQFGVRFFAPFAFVEQEELSDLSEVDKVFSTNPTPKHSDSDIFAKISNIKPFGYNNIVQFHDKIEEMFDPMQKTFQKCGKPLRFSAGDYFIRNCTSKHIKVFACALHKIISLNCVLTLLQTKAIELGHVKMRPIIMANTDVKTVQFKNKLATADGFYFAEDCYSMNINEEMANKYIQLCEMITPEFYDILGVYLEDYNSNLTAIQLQHLLTKLGKLYTKHFQKDQIRNAQLRKYLNTIHNYFLKKRECSTRNTYNELIDVYKSLITAVQSYNSVSSIDFINEALENPRLFKDLKVEKHDVVVSPQLYNKFSTEAKNGKVILNSKINEKLFCFNKTTETQLNKKYNDLEERLNKKDQTIKELQEIVIGFNNKIDITLGHINFNKNAILQITAEFKAYMIEPLNKKKKKKHDKMMSKTVRDLGDTSCKILSVLEAMNDNLKCINDHRTFLAKLPNIETRLIITDQKLNEINESLKFLNLNK